MAYLNRAGEIQLFREDFPRLKLSVAVLVRKNDDLVEPFARRTFCWIAVSLHHPNAPALVPRESDRLVQVWLAGDQFNLETLGHEHFRDGAFGFCLRRCVAGIRFQVAQHRAGLQPLDLRQRVLGSR